MSVGGRKAGLNSGLASRWSWAATWATNAREDSACTSVWMTGIGSGMLSAPSAPRNCGMTSWSPWIASRPFAV